MDTFLIQQLVSRSAERHPDRVAIVAPRRKGSADQLTYAELEERSNQAARALVGLGVRPGDRVALSMEKSIDAIVTVLGVLKAGAAYVPVDPFTPPARAAQVLRGCGVELVVTRDDRADAFAEQLAGTEGGVPTLRRVIGPQAFAEAPGDAPSTAGLTEASLAYVLHTSGSTGVPKGVAITHRNALAFVDVAADAFSITSDDRLAAHAPLHFDLSVFDLYCAFLRGASVVLLPEYFGAFPAKMVEAIAAHGVTVWNSVVSALTLMLDRGKLDRARAASIRCCIFSGELMPLRVLSALREVMPEAALYNVYGQTEANSSLFHRVDELPAGDDARLPIGKPLPNFDVFALTEEGRLVEEPGPVGELHVRAPTVATGYYGDDARTREKFVLDPRRPADRVHVYRTGDLVRRDAEGRFFYVGRVDNLIKTRGYRVEPGEIELVLAGAPGVAEAVVLAVPDKAIGHRLWAVLVTESGATVEVADVLRHTAERLPQYMVPERVEVRRELPRTSTGKVDKRALARELLPE